MTNPHKIIAWVALAVIMAVFTGCKCVNPYGPPSAPRILCHPQTQVVQVGSTNVTFEVEAENFPPPFSTDPISYQWQINKSPGASAYTNIPGATNYEFTVSCATTNDVAYYRVSVSASGGTSTSEPASLMVWSTNSPLTVYGTVYSGTPSGAACTGSYAGYVTYWKTASAGWGWAPSTTAGHTTHTASDLILTNKVSFLGSSGGTDKACAIGTVSRSHPEPSTKYRFAIYFPSTPLPSTPYPITLTEFDP